MAVQGMYDGVIKSQSVRGHDIAKPQLSPCTSGFSQPTNEGALPHLSPTTVTDATIAALRLATRMDVGPAFLASSLSSWRV